jgi:hypothetical protein
MRLARILQCVFGLTVIAVFFSNRCDIPVARDYMLCPWIPPIRTTASESRRTELRPSPVRDSLIYVSECMNKLSVHVKDHKFVNMVEIRSQMGQAARLSSKAAEDLQTWLLESSVVQYPLQLDLKAIIGKLSSPGQGHLEGDELFGYEFTAQIKVNFSSFYYEEVFHNFNHTLESMQSSIETPLNALDCVKTNVESLATLVARQVPALDIKIQRQENNIGSDMRYWLGEPPILGMLYQEKWMVQEIDILLRHIGVVVDNARSIYSVRDQLIAASSTLRNERISLLQRLKETKVRLLEIQSWGKDEVNGTTLALGRIRKRMEHLVPDP